MTPDYYIGGMVTAGGIGLRVCGCGSIIIIITLQDIGALNSVGNTSFPYRWAMLNAQHYGVDYPVWQPDNYVGNASFWAFLNNANVPVSCHDVDVDDC